MKIDSSCFRSNLFASFVLFLVAIPLNLGIALASGVGAAAGLVSGVVGGLLVGLMAGCPLMVTGPATGLIAMVWQISNKHGLESLGVVVLGAGILQIAIGLLRLGPWFRAVSPAVIQGMLGGIGVLIFASQFHVMLASKPSASGWQNIRAIPQVLTRLITEGTRRSRSCSKPTSRLPRSPSHTEKPASAPFWARVSGREESPSVR